MNITDLLLLKIYVLPGVSGQSSLHLLCSSPFSVFLSPWTPNTAQISLTLLNTHKTRCGLHIGPLKLFDLVSLQLFQGLQHLQCEDNKGHDKPCKSLFLSFHKASEPSRLTWLLPILRSSRCLKRHEVNVKPCMD